MIIRNKKQTIDLKCFFKLIAKSYGKANIYCTSIIFVDIKLSQLFAAKHNKIHRHPLHLSANIVSLLIAPFPNPPVI